MTTLQGIFLLLLVGATFLWGTQATHLLPKRTAGGRGRIISIEEYGAVADRSITKWSFRNLEDDDETDGAYADEEIQDQKFTDWDIQRAINNTLAFNLAIDAAQPGDIVVIPDGKSFSFTGGIIANDKYDIVIDFAGSSHFVPVRDIWPFATTPNSTFHGNPRYNPAIAIFNCTGVTLTSSSITRAKVNVDYKKNTVTLVRPFRYFGGIINGNGKPWWDDVIVGKQKDRRPRLVHIMESANMLVEYLTLLNSPFWTLTVEGIDSEVRYVNVLVDRKYQSGPSHMIDSSTIARRLDARNIPFPIDDLPDWIGRKFRQPQDLNTDGIDPIGQNIWVHDCIIQNADDSVAVKPSHGGRDPSRIGDCTHNVTVENMVLTGFGASIGSVAPHDFHRCLDNVTFRNITMPGTGKGIYIKSDWGGFECYNQTGQATNILYENIKLYEPFWWPIWIGPQQQHQPNSKLNMKCGLTWPIEPHCPVPGCIQMENITLRNIKILNPVISPAVILGNATFPMKNVVIEDLRVTESKTKIWLGKWPFHESHYPWHGRIKCEHASGSYRNSHPVPGCLTPQEGHRRTNVTF